MIQNVRLLALLLMCTLLAACASTHPAAESGESRMPSLMAETDDLAMVADSAIQLSNKPGVGSILVVFDIDNTLLAMEQDLGSDQWYYWQKALADEDPCSGMLVEDRFKVQGALFAMSAMRPTQADSAAQVRRLQDAGITVIAVTSRGPDYRLQTFRELRRNGISFWPSALPPQAGFTDAFIPEGASLNTIYEDGVFLTAGQNKGLMIQALLKRSNTPWPDVIVIADDKSKSLKEVMTAFRGSDTAVHAWRYTREDSSVAAFDPIAAHQTWQAVKPALLKIESIFGPDNYDLPSSNVREGCG